MSVNSSNNSNPVQIVLPDGNVKDFPGPVSGLDIAKSICPSLAKASLAIKIDGKLFDLSTVVKEKAKIEIVTLK